MGWAIVERWATLALTRGSEKLQECPWGKRVEKGEGRMRTFIFVLAAIVPAFAIDRASAADELPAFDIARNCSAETVGAVTGGPASCTRDETEAKNQLANRWSSFSASQKKDCVEESSIGGEKSYVELLTCLEMASGQFSTGRGQKQ